MVRLPLLVLWRCWAVGAWLESEVVRSFGAGLLWAVGDLSRVFLIQCSWRASISSSSRLDRILWKAPPGVFITLPKIEMILLTLYFATWVASAMSLIFCSSS